MKIITGLEPRVSYFRVPATMDSVSVYGADASAALPIPDMAVGECWVVEYRDSMGHAYTTAVYWREPQIERKSVKARFSTDAKASFNEAAWEHMLREHNVPEDAVTERRPSYGTDTYEIKASWWEVTV